MDTFREKVGVFVEKFKSSKKLSLLAVLLLIAAVPLTVFIAQQQQDVRQRASTGTASVTVSKTSLTPGEQFTTSWANIEIAPTNAPTNGPTPTATPVETLTPTPTPDPNKVTLTATVECTTQPDMYKSAGPTVTLRFNTLPTPVMFIPPGLPGMPTMAPVLGNPPRYILTRTPEFPYSDPPWKMPKTVDIGNIAKDGFITVYDGSYIGLENGKHYEYWITPYNISGGANFAESNHVSIDTPSAASCPIPATSPRNLQAIGSCTNGQAAYELRFNRMPYYEESLGLDQIPAPANGTSFKAGMVNPRPLGRAGTLLPQANVPIHLKYKAAELILLPKLQPLGHVHKAQFLSSNFKIY